MERHYVCLECTFNFKGTPEKVDGTYCPKCNGKIVPLAEEDSIYLEEIDSWLKEQQARERALQNTIETSSEIVRQNEIQLNLHQKRVQLAITEHNRWRKEKGMSTI
jgi:DNA-directed RNA polymerase subunit RPC12/RpoP